jgi:hypothetical protein
VLQQEIVASASRAVGTQAAIGNSVNQTGLKAQTTYRALNTL